MFHGNILCVVFSELSPRSFFLPTGQRFPTHVMSASRHVLSLLPLGCFLIPTGRHLEFPWTIPLLGTHWPLNPFLLLGAHVISMSLCELYFSTNHNPPFWSGDRSRPITRQHANEAKFPRWAYITTTIDAIQMLYLEFDYSGDFLFM